jgi:TonB-dependent SusC/RagA subfamily outer membrane receptor
MKSIALLTLFLFMASLAHAQTRVVRGSLTVFDTYPVKNVVVSSKKAKASATTDSLGQFSLVCMEEDLIKVKTRVFKPFKKKVDASTDSVTMNLQFINSEKNRKIAVGYGYINEKDLSYSISHLDESNDEFCSYSNIYDLIKGQLPGVSVSGSKVYIRGGTNSLLLDTEALYVVDGQVTSTIDWIHPCQVKSIDVLKDSSASVYGSRGGNGVVLIETRR